MKESEEAHPVNDIPGSDIENLENRCKESSVPRRDEEVQYPKGLELGMIIFAIWVAFFLVALVSSQYQGAQTPGSMGKKLGLYGTSTNCNNRIEQS